MAVPEYLRELITKMDVPGNLVATGESLVFEVSGKSGPEAWHVYPSLYQETILRYQNLTQRVADLINNQQGVIQTLDTSLQYSFTWKVVPIDDVIFHGGYPIAISKFIYGDTLSELLKKSENVKNLHPLQQIEASDPGIVAANLTEFCGKLNTKLRTTTVWFTPVNTKAVGQEIVVTDVSSAVQNLAYGF